MKRFFASLIVGLLVLSMFLFAFPTQLAYASTDAYWVGGTGNWSDNATHWAATSNGTPGAPLPTSTTSVHFDSNSFTGVGQNVTVDGFYPCLNMSWTGSLYNPTYVTTSFGVEVFGNATFIPDMSNIGSTIGIFFYGSGNNSLTTNGLHLSGGVGFDVNYTGTLSLQDDLYAGVQINTVMKGVLNTNGHMITTRYFQNPGGSARTLNLGASVINVSTDFNSLASAAAITGTSSIRLTSTASFEGGGLTYNEVQFNGTAHTISGNNTLASIGFNPVGVQTITFTDNSTQTTTTATRTGSGIITMQGSAAAGWAVTKAGGGTIELDNISISRSTGNPVNTWYAGGTSTNGGNNSQWYFIPVSTTSAVSGISMTRDGVTAATVTGNVTDMGSAASIQGFFNYGPTALYGSNTTPQAVVGVGNYNTTLPNNLTPGGTYHVRSSLTSGPLSYSNGDASFAFTLPTHATSAATSVGMGPGTHATLNGAVTNMGVASDTYGYFEWGYTTAYGNTIANHIIAGMSSVSDTISGFDPNRTVHYRFNIRNGGVTVNGADQSFSVANSNPSSPSYIAFNFTNGVVPVLFVAFVIFILMALALREEISPLMAIILMAVVILMGLAFLTGIQSLINGMFGG